MTRIFHDCLLWEQRAMILLVSFSITMHFLQHISLLAPPIDIVHRILHLHPFLVSNTFEL